MNNFGLPEHYRRGYLSTLLPLKCLDLQQQQDAHVPEAQILFNQGRNAHAFAEYASRRWPPQVSFAHHDIRTGLYDQ